MSKPAKKSARVRLLEHVGEYVRAFQRGESFATLDARTRRLLRAHERELVERAVRHHRIEMGPRAHKSSDDSMRTAILGPRAAKRGGK